MTAAPADRARRAGGADRAAGNQRRGAAGRRRPPAAQPIAPATRADAHAGRAGSGARPAGARRSTPEAAPAPPPPALRSRLAGPSAQALVTGRTMYATEAVNVRDAPGTNGTSVLVTLNAREQVTRATPLTAGCRSTRGRMAGSSRAISPTARHPNPHRRRPRRRTAASSGNWMEALIPRGRPERHGHLGFRRNGGWGASDGHTNYIDPNVPADKRFSVMVHELATSCRSRSTAAWASRSPR